ncbi:MAG: metal ABC transporter permease [Planctomycetota bacterium]
MSIELWTLAIAVVTAATCGLCGSVLVAGRQAMVSEGLSHAVLPGLVIAFIAFRSFDSPWLIILAAASGLIMVVITRAIAETGLVDSDAGLGLVFAAMFSIGILLVNLNLKNTHFHADCIVDGNLALAALDRIEVPMVGRVPKSFLTMSVTLLIVLAFVMVAYKELKVMLFDPTHAARVGLRPVLLGYCWIALVSLTTVTAFEVAGSVLIVALMIAPAASAFLLTHRLSKYMTLSVVLAIIDSVLGFYLARTLDISPTGPIASMAGLVFLLVYALNPSRRDAVSNHRVPTAQQHPNHMLRCLSCEVISGTRTPQDAANQLCNRLGFDGSEATQMVQDLITCQWIDQSGASLGYSITPEGQQAIDQVLA